MLHKYQFSLDLLRQAIAKAPRFFPSGRKQDMTDALAAFEADPNASQEDIEAAITAFGKEIWPYRKAFWHIHDTDGRHDENRYLAEMLSPGLRAKYEEFLGKGYRVEDVRRGGVFEDFFTPEEKQALIETKLMAHDRVVEAIESLCVGEHKQVCEDALAGYRAEQQKIEKLIADLKAYAGRSEKWRAEILDKVKVFEAGWSGLEKEVTVDDVRGEIDYYQGVIELFE
ncbi:MAG: hypothetical protein AB1715_13060 [Acidobacteriota bacterium]